MRKVKDAIDLNTGEKVYFRGHAQSTYMSDGRNVEEAINEIPQGGGSGVDASLETLPNGNIKVTINGVSKDFMAATPSGDPLHEAYIAAGADWNGGTTDIIKTAPWADFVDNEEEKVVTHKAGCWYLHGIGDFTTTEMRGIYNRGRWNELNKAPLSHAGLNKQKTLLARVGQQNAALNATSVVVASYNIIIEVINIGIYLRTDINYSSQYTITGATQAFPGCTKLAHIIGSYINFEGTDNNGLNFNNCSSLVSVLIRIKKDLSLKNCAKLSYASVKYLITNSAPPSQVVLTLHPTALANAETRYLADASQDLETYPTLSDWALSKKIQIATA